MPPAERSPKGPKNSDAKRGVRQVELAEDEILLTTAKDEGLASYERLKKGISSGPDGPIDADHPEREPWLRHRTQRVPGGRDAVIFHREWLDEDLSGWDEAAGGTPKERAAKALRARERERMRAEGCIQLKEAVAAVDSEPLLVYETVSEWVRRNAPNSVVVGPRGDYWVRSQEEFEADLDPFRCSKEGCSRFALLSASGRGRCRIHEPCVDRGGRPTAEEFAEKYRIDDPSLLARLEAGEIPSELEDRRGRPGGWLIDEEKALPVIRERFVCKKDGCERFALGQSGYCCMHAGGAVSAALAPLIREQIAAEGLLTQEQALAVHPSGYSAERMQRAGVGELRRYYGYPRWVYSHERVVAWKPPWADPPMRKRRAKVARAVHGHASASGIWGRLAPAIAAENDKPVGRPPGLTDAQEKQIRWLLRRGYSRPDVARYVGCSYKQVRRIAESAKE